MKLAHTLSLACLATVTCLPQSAEARSGDKALAAVGGFIGGVIVGAHLDRGDRHHHAPVVVDHCPPPPVVVVDRGPSRHRGGYWAEQTVRVWVPGRTIWTRDHYGRRVRIEEPGYYELRRERVWVEEARYGRRW